MIMNLASFVKSLTARQFPLEFPGHWVGGEWLKAPKAPVIKESFNPSRDEKLIEVRLERSGVVRATVQAASLLAETASGPPTPSRLQSQWSPEYARIPGSREVTVEAIVNGRPVAGQRLTADGSLRDLALDIPIQRSSWIALRILGSAHTNPVFVLVGDRPIRASRKSAEWCLKSVDQCWSQKSPRISPVERPAAQRAYDHARQQYRLILSESDAD